MHHIKLLENPTMTSAAMQVYSMPELMKHVYEYDATYYVPYEKCLSELPQALEEHARLHLGRKLLDMYVTKDMEELGYTLVKVVSCETDELVTSGYEVDSDYESDYGSDDEDDEDEDTSSDTSDTSVLSALRLETSWYIPGVTVTCKYKLPDSDVVRLHEAYIEHVRYQSHDKKLTSAGYHAVQELDTDDEC